MRTTERMVCAALADACEAMGLPCAYERDGSPKTPYSDIYALSYVDDVTHSGRTYGAHIVDYHSQYGGVRIHAYPGDGGGGHCRAHGSLTANGIPSGMDRRESLRDVRAKLLQISADAWRARGEWEVDHLGDPDADDARAAAAEQDGGNR